MTSGGAPRPYEFDPAVPSPPDSTPPTAASAIDPAVLRDNNVPCLNCGYNIRGLSPDGVCPECGVPIERSLKGNLLVYSSPQYVASLHRGLIMILVAVLLQLLFIVLGVFAAIFIGVAAGPRTGALEQGIAILFTPVAVLSLIGWWLFSAPDPAVIGNQGGETPRLIVRVTVIVVAVASLISLLVATVPTTGGDVVDAVASGLSGIAGIAQFFASLLYVRWLGPRLPDLDITKRAQQYMWLLPVIFIVGLCLLVGPLIATVMYYFFLNRVRLAIKNVRQRQEAEGYHSALI